MNTEQLYNVLYSGQDTAAAWTQFTHEILLLNSNIKLRPKLISLTTTGGSRNSTKQRRQSKENRALMEPLMTIITNEEKSKRTATRENCTRGNQQMGRLTDGKNSK